MTSAKIKVGQWFYSFCDIVRDEGAVGSNPAIPI